MKKQKIQKLTTKDFEEVLERPLSPFIKKRIKTINFQYKIVLKEERDEIIKRIVTTLLDPTITKSGAHRKPQWERGWGENLELYQKEQNQKNILPLYFSKYPIFRWKQQFIEGVSDRFEYFTLAIIVDWLFDKYLRKFNAIYEFGCGTGHHLLRLREINKDALIYGLDWVNSSVKLINAYAKETKDKKIKAKRFDFFHPDHSFKLEKDAAVYTVAALEQVGENHKEFIQYLLEQKPKLCIHIEPIAELLDPENSLIDFLSVEYFKKRNYLNGFLDYLRELEKEKKIKIHHTQRTHIGSLYIEGYSIIVWSPI